MLFRVAGCLLMAFVPAVASAQSSAPLMVTAHVVRSCKVDVAAAAAPSQFPTLPVALTCVKNAGAAARVQRPAPPRRSEARGELVVINF